MDTVTQIGEWTFWKKNGLHECAVEILLRGRILGFYAPGLIEKLYSGMIGFDVLCTLDLVVVGSLSFVVLGA